MKTLLILVLLVGLLAATFFTRPSRASFDAYVQAQVIGGQRGTVHQALRGLAKNISADGYLRTVTFHDHILWTTIEQDGRPQYVGAYGHWFKRDVK
jgi:hypothetical protein